ncbi:usherin-like [Patella vulgata]|uniref:usherin-like n=1 Tax=Patella vulgata TaxID=6465 RepID=UPI0024A82216|nr:usherin-like [Patella vulgata]
MSDVVNATTEESAPEGLPDPIVTSPSWAELEVTWGEPELPNGVIVRYELYHNSIMVTSGLTREYRVDNLQPYSLHIIQVKACTSIGCGYSNEVKTRTQEAAPEGIVTLEVVGLDPRSVNATWTAPEKPNGHLYFDVYFDGIFYKDAANRDYRTDVLRKSLLRTNDSYKWTVIDNLIPYTIYKIQVNASNTKGFILSNIVSRNMPAGTPDGVSPPSLVSETPNSIKAQWPPVGRVNSNEEPSYILQFREKRANSIVQE